VLYLLEIVSFKENLNLKFELVSDSYVILLLLIYLWVWKENLDIYRKLYEYLRKCPSSGVKRLSAFIAGKNSCHRTQKSSGSYKYKLHEIHFLENKYRSF
jgi:hypothetical protein